MEVDLQQLAGYSTAAKAPSEIDEARRASPVGRLVAERQKSDAGPFRHT
jgi:hypothetical protein